MYMGRIMLKTSNSNLNETDNDRYINYFTLSTTKLVIMSVSTFGLYLLYWFYKNWVAINNSGKNCSPFLRAFFTPIFAYSCFKHIKVSMRKNNVFSNFSAVKLAASYFILQATVNLPDPYCFISFLTFLPIITANNAATAIKKVQNPDYCNATSFSFWNYLVIAPGATLLILGVLGLLLQEVLGHS